MTSELARLDATAQADLVRTGQITPVELVEAAIRRVEAVDGEINAVIHRRFEEAIAEASDGLPEGPFHGVPITLKDLWPSSAGDPFHQGVRGMLDADYRHPADSNLVQRYREAGFVIIGRTNTPEMGLSATTEPLSQGPTRNPWNTSRGPGGSSGGAAASVAAGMTAIANASDGGGSIRIPAAHCGLVGLKPSRGRISMGPMQDEWGNSVQHVVCHSVRDSAAVLDATARPFVTDGVVAPTHVDSFAAQIGADPGSLRIGVTTESRAEIATHPDCAAAALKVAKILESLGHMVTGDSPGAFHRSEATRAMGILTAVSTRSALTELGEMAGRAFTADDVEPGTWLLAEMAESITGVQVIEAQAAQHRHRRDLCSWWEDFDLLLTPTTAVPPPIIGDMRATTEEPFKTQLESIPHATFTSQFNASGQPALSLPAGFTEDRLPLGAQLVAAYGREDLLIAVGAQLEQQLTWADTRAPMHP